ncbi:MAG: hypothetical protein PWQ43_934, partial [Rikenellaceae bacterium]|nr:hypothetical protein [Rikenellaceae bacterium]
IIFIIIIIFILSYNSPNLNEKDLKRCFINKTNISVDDTFIISKYENTGPSMYDYSETYYIKVTNADYINILKEIKLKHKNWIKNSKGYELYIPQNKYNDTCFVFQIDTINKFLIISIIEE